MPFAELYDWLPMTLFCPKRQKFTTEKDEVTITKSHFQTIEKDNPFLNHHILPQQHNHNTYQPKQTHKSAIDDCNLQQVKTKRTTAYGKIKVDKLFRKPFCTKISRLAVQFVGEKQQIHTKPTFHRILKFH